jgi:hypothetical protein
MAPEFFVLFAEAAASEVEVLCNGIAVGACLSRPVLCRQTSGKKSAFIVGSAIKLHLQACQFAL